MAEDKANALNQANSIKLIIGGSPEDDGGTIKDWNCTALVRVESRSYGIELKIPYRSSDDIVWRGTLGRKWFEAYSDIKGHFGDVDLTFELVEKKL